MYTIVYRRRPRGAAFVIAIISSSHPRTHALLPIILPAKNRWTFDINQTINTYFYDDVVHSDLYTVSFIPSTHRFDQRSIGVRSHLVYGEHVERCESSTKDRLFEPKRADCVPIERFVQTVLWLPNRAEHERTAFDLLRFIFLTERAGCQLYIHAWALSPNHSFQCIILSDVPTYRFRWE